MPRITERNEISESGNGMILIGLCYGYAYGRPTAITFDNPQKMNRGDRGTMANLFFILDLLQIFLWHINVLSTNM